MKKTVIKFIAVLLIIVLSFPISVFALPESGAAETEDVSGSNLIGDFQKVLENKAYELYFSADTAEISVVCKENGFIWYSNPQNGENKSSKEKSQIVVYYYESRDLTSVDSYEFCVASEDKLSWEIKNESLVVTYDIGDNSFTADALPTVLSKQRMEKDILSKLNDDEKQVVLSRFSLYSKEKLDENAFKTIKLNFPSIEKHDLYIRSKMPDYIAEEVYALFQKAGYTHEDLQSDCDENGIENTYTAKPSFHVELTYTLTEDGLTATVDTKKIRFEENYKPCRIEILPFFGAGISEKGYMIVPDGSGAVIEFDNGKYNSNPYWKKLFNNDNALTTEETSAKSQVSVLPLFAISKENSGFLATIDSGYEAAGISADVAGGNNNYNYVNAFFDIFSADEVSLSNNEQDKFILTNQKILSSDLEISYHFLNGEHTYSDLALCYREYLIKNGILSDKKTDNSAIEFDFLGTVQVTKRFLGVPYKTMETMTTYGQALELIEKSGAKGVDICFRDSLKGGKLQKTADNLKLQSILGSKKELSSILGLDGQFAVSYYTQYAQKVKKSDSAVTLSKSTAKFYNYDFISRYVNANNALGVISASKLEKLALKVGKSNEYEAVNILDSGYQLNSDFNAKSPVDRSEARVNVQKYLEKISESSEVWAETGSIFSLPYIDKIKAIPVKSSGYHIEDYSIPFYEIAISGYIPYSVPSINTADDSRRQFLKAAETGSKLQYTWIYELPDNITDNGTEYYKYLYKNSFEQAKEYYKEYKPLYEKISNSAIKEHSNISDTLIKTVFDNGVTVYINYSEEEAQIEGFTVEANDFIFTE